MPLNPSPVFLFKPIYEILDEPLVNGVWSLSFRQSVGLKILAIMLLQENDEVADKDLNLRLIIDGVVHDTVAPITFVNGVPQYVFFDSVSDVPQTNVALVMPYFDGIVTAPLECGNVQVLVGIDSMAGTNQRYCLLIRWFGAG